MSDLASAGPAAPAEASPAGPPGAAGASASLRRRLAALIYEGLLLSAVVLVAGFLFAAFASPSPAASTTGAGLQIPALPARALLFCALFAIGALYFGWSWTGGRRTPPMKTWRMRMTLRDGRLVTPSAAIARYCAAWIGPALALIAYVSSRPAGHARYALLLLGFCYLWALVDRERQFLHDRIAGTRIVGDRAGA